IFLSEIRLALGLSFIVETAGAQRGQNSGTCFNEPPACCQHFLACDQDFRVVLLNDSDRLFDGVRRDRPEYFRGSGRSSSDQHADGCELQAHFVYLLAKAFLAPGMPSDFCPYIRSCKPARLRTHSALAILVAAKGRHHYRG